MSDKLKPCPFCGCEMRFESNRDWHRIKGEHVDCYFEDDHEGMWPASKEGKEQALEYWNTRAEKAGGV